MPRASPRKRASVNYNEDEPQKSVASKAAAKVTSLAKKAVSKRKADSEEEPVARINGTKETKKRKTKAEKEEDAMPLAQRTVVATLQKGMHIGAHVSAAGGVQNAVTNALHIGANSFALFLKSQRKWDNPPLSDEAKDLFISACKHHGYNAAEHAVPHGSYLVNLAQPDPAKADQAYKGFLDDLKRCEALGIKLYNFHPGTTGGEPRAEAIGRIASQLNKAHKETATVITLLENMAGAGNVIGNSWEDLRDIIELVEDKARVGVCIDTCHAFAAGHDLRSPEAFSETMTAFNNIVGEKYLKAFHVNDSKAPFRSNRDLHANIGTGFLGLRAFHNLMNHAPSAGKPMMLETPIDRKDDKGKTVEDKQVWADEIKLLERLVGMDADSKEFIQLEEELWRRGEGERKRIQDQVDKKAEKDAKKGTRGKKKKGRASDEDSD
ncbi:hypothetical protein NLU13_9227 [Sarocladium strictum]|uniref:Apurinic-apyrimidinic endonuclease 1 n=1 Tax=Sarocladium strictum TaxID=5046 RepID=A0AA39L482_SARSR|nr:hypothetical protein NLU13_9227 [Sarocladium strictum]